MRKAFLLCVVLIFPQMCFGSGIGDICIKLNGGADVVYTNQPNILEIWIENDLPLEAMSFGLEFAWDPSVTIAWDVGYGNDPPLNEHGRAIGAWDFSSGVMGNLFSDNISTDSISIGGVAMSAYLPAGTSELCYSMKFDAYIPPGIVFGGFSVEPTYCLPATNWDFIEHGGISYAPDFCGNTIADPHDPEAPPVYFDVVNDCGDLNSDGNINVTDLVWILDWMFSDGPAPIGEADMDECGSVNMGDVMYLIAYMFLGGDYPCEGSVTCDLPTGTNSVDLGCPLDVNEPTGDTIPLPIYFTNDTELGAISLGFHHNSPDIEIISVSFTGSVLPSGLVRKSTVDLAANEVEIYWSDFVQFNPQAGGLLATLWLDIPEGTPQQTVDIDTVFIGPATEFMYAPRDLGKIIPAFNDCGVADIVITQPQQHACGDADCSGAVDIDDVVYLIQFIFAGGASPCDPDDNGQPDCGK